MFKLSSFGTNTCLKTFVPLVNCVIDDALSVPCLPVVNKSDVPIVVGFRVWSDLCSNLNFGLFC